MQPGRAGRLAGEESARHGFGSCQDLLGVGRYLAGHGAMQPQGPKLVARHWSTSVPGCSPGERVGI